LSCELVNSFYKERLGKKRVIEYPPDPPKAIAREQKSKMRLSSKNELSPLMIEMRITATSIIIVRIIATHSTKTPATKKTPQIISSIVTICAQRGERPSILKREIVVPKSPKCIIPWDIKEAPTANLTKKSAKSVLCEIRLFIVFDILIILRLVFTYYRINIHKSNKERNHKGS